MGAFTEGLRAGANIVTSGYNNQFNARIQDRADSQLSLNEQEQNRKNLQTQAVILANGYIVGADSKVKPNENTQNKQELENEQLKATLKATQEQQKAIQSKFNADSIAKITEGFMSGNIDDALKAWKNTPGLKEAITAAPSLNTQDIDVINFNSPDDIQQLKDMGVDETHLQDPEVQDAIKRSFMRVQGHDGKWRLASVDQVTKQTNSKAFMTKEQADRYAEGARKVLATIQGLNPKTEDIKDQQIELTSDKLEITQNALKSGDPKEAMFALSLTNPELFLKAMKQGSSRRDALEQYTTAFMRAHPKATPEQFQNAMAKFVNAKGEGVGSNRENTDVAIVKAKANIKEPEEKKAFNSETDILTSLKQTDKTKYDLVNRNIKTMDVNYQLATNIDKVLSGPAQNIDTNAIQAAKDKLHKWFGVEDEKTINNAIFKTKGGALLATYILSRSGTAASDNERAFLQDLMMSGNLDDEKYVRNSLKAFKESLGEQNQTAAKAIQEYAPYSAKKYSLSQQEAQPATKPEAVKQVVYQGKTYNVDADGNMTEVTK